VNKIGDFEIENFEHVRFEPKRSIFAPNHEEFEGHEGQLCSLI